MKLVKTQKMSDSESSQPDPISFLNFEALKKLQIQKQKSLTFIQKIQQEGRSQCHSLLKEIYKERKLPIQQPQIIKKYLDKRVQKMIRNKQLKRNWSINDIQILLWMVSQNLKKNCYVRLDDLKPSDWKQISSLIPGSKPKSCMIKLLSLKRTNLTQLKWSHDQSSLLKQLAQKYNKNWKKISQQLYFQGKQKIFRTAKQCKQHWSSFLNPQIKKTPWSSQQDFLLFYHILMYQGQKKWVQIKQKIHSRTQNALKNRYVLLIQKSKKQQPNLSEFELIIQNLCRIVQIDFFAGTCQRQINLIKNYYQRQIKNKYSFCEKFQVKVQQEQSNNFQPKQTQLNKRQSINVCPNLKNKKSSRQVDQICQTKEGFYILSQKKIPQ